MTRTISFIILSILSAHICFSQNTGNTKVSLDSGFYTRAFFSGKHVRHVKIETRNKHVLSTIEVPEGVTLSVYADAQIKTDNANQFTGRISIRTKLSSEIGNGTDAESAMGDAPLRLDLPDAIVTVTTDKS